MSCPPQVVIDPSSSYFAYQAFLFVTTSCVYIILPLSFWYAKKYHKYQRMILRKTAFPFIYASGYFMLLFAEVLAEVVIYPCGLQTFFYLLVSPILVSAQMCRNLRILFVTKFYEISRIYGKMSETEQDELNEYRSSVRDLLRESYIAFVEAGNPDRVFKQGEKVKALFYLKFLSSSKGIVTIFSTMMFVPTVFAIAFSLQSQIYRECSGCRRDLTLTLIVLVEAALGVGLGLFVSYQIRHLPDPFGMVREGRLILLFLAPALIGLALDVALFDSSKFNPDQLYMRYVFNTVYCFFCACALFVHTAWQIYVAHQLSSSTVSASGSQHKSNLGSEGSPVLLTYKTPRRDSKSAGTTSSIVSNDVENNSKEWLDIKTSSAFLYKILINESYAKEFEMLLTKEFAIENLYYLKDTHEWELNYTQIAQSARLARAKRIMKTYLKVDSVYAINLPSEMTSRLTDAIAKDVEIKDDVFHESRKEIAQLLNKGQARRFLIAKMEQEKKRTTRSAKSSGKSKAGGSKKNSVAEEESDANDLPIVIGSI